MPSNIYLVLSLTKNILTCYSFKHLFFNHLFSTYYLCYHTRWSKARKITKPWENESSTKSLEEYPPWNIFKQIKFCLIKVERNRSKLLRAWSVTACCSPAAGSRCTMRATLHAQAWLRLVAVHEEDPLLWKGAVPKHLSNKKHWLCCQTIHTWYLTNSSYSIFGPPFCD